LLIGGLSIGVYTNILACIRISIASAAHSFIGFFGLPGRVYADYFPGYWDLNSILFRAFGNKTWILILTCFFSGNLAGGRG